MTSVGSEAIGYWGFVSYRTKPEKYSIEELRCSFAKGLLNRE